MTFLCRIFRSRLHAEHPARKHISPACHFIHFVVFLQAVFSFSRNTFHTTCILLCQFDIYFWCLFSSLISLWFVLKSDFYDPRVFVWLTRIVCFVTISITVLQYFSLIILYLVTEQPESQNYTVLLVHKKVLNYICWRIKWVYFFGLTRPLKTGPNPWGIFFITGLFLYSFFLFWSFRSLKILKQSIRNTTPYLEGFLFFFCILGYNWNRLWEMLSCHFNYAL